MNNNASGSKNFDSLFAIQNLSQPQIILKKITFLLSVVSYCRCQHSGLVTKFRKVCRFFFFFKIKSAFAARSILLLMLGFTSEDTRQTQLTIMNTFHCYFRSFLNLICWSAIKYNFTPAHFSLFCFGLLRWSRNGLNPSAVIRKHISHSSYKL